MTFLLWYLLASNRCRATAVFPTNIGSVLGSWGLWHETHLCILHGESWKWTYLHSVTNSRHQQLFQLSDHHDYISSCTTWVRRTGSELGNHDSFCHCKPPPHKYGIFAFHRCWLHYQHDRIFRCGIRPWIWSSIISRVILYCVAM
jgi:hypothetical protein